MASGEPADQQDRRIGPGSGSNDVGVAGVA